MSQMIERKPEAVDYVDSSGQSGRVDYIDVFRPGHNLDIRLESDVGIVGKVVQQVNKVLTSPTAQTAFDYLFEIILDLVLQLERLVPFELAPLIEPIVRRRRAQIEIRGKREEIPPILTEDDL